MKTSDIFQWVIFCCWFTFVHICGLIAIIQFIGKRLQAKKQQTCTSKRPTINTVITPEANNIEDLDANVFDKESATPFVENDTPASAFTITGDFYILERHRRCFRCKKTTPVIAFALKDYYRGSKTAKTTQRVPKSICLLSDVSPIPSAMRDILMKRFAYYTSLRCKDDIPTNHCNYCGAPQGNFYLFDEPYEPLEEGQFSGGPIDNDATFYKIAFQRELVLNSSLEGCSFISRDSTQGRVSKDIISWE